MLAVLGSGVLVAQAAKKAKSKAPKSQQMKVACASSSNAVMRYVSRASKCKKSEKVVTIDVNKPIDACVKLHGTQNGQRGSLSQLRAARRLPAGTVRLSPPADCPAKVQPNEIGIKIPGPKKQWYCGRKSDGRLRWASGRSKCDKKRELPIWVPQGSPLQEQPATPAGPANKSPKGNGDSATTDKDAPVAIAVLGNDTDDDGDPLSVESVNTNGTTGSVTPNANGTITYDPAGKFDNLKPGQTASDSFKYKVQDNHGGHSGETQVDVTIKGKNLSPKAVNDSSSTDEETAKNLNVLANDTDAEGDSLTLGPIDDTGTVGDVSAGPGNTIDYDPNNQFEDLGVGETRLDTFKYRANDGNSNSAPATVTMTVTGVNDEPTVDTTNSSLAYTENVAAPVDSGVAVDDVDGDQIAGATVAISNNFQNGDGDTLGFSTQNGITGTYASGTGVLTLTGNASVADYQTALRSVTFNETSQHPSTLTRTVSFKVKDQHNADSNTDTRDVAVTRVNDAPVNALASAGALDVAEDGNVTASGFSISDTDAGSDAMQTELKVLHGKLDVAAGGTVTGNGTSTVKIEGTQTQISTSLASVKYTPTADYAGSDTLTMDTSDLGHNPAPAQTDSDNYAISVAAVNDAPVITRPATATLNEDASKTFATGGADEISIADVDSDSGDIKADLSVGHGTVTLGDIAGLTTVTTNGTSSVSLTGTRTQVNEALAGLVYAPTADYNGGDSLSISVDDQGNTGSGGPQTDSKSVAITVNAVNDAPANTLASPGALDVGEDGNVTASGFSISDVDAGSDAMETELNVLHGKLDVAAGGTVTNNGTATVTIAGSQAQINASLASVKYTPAADFAGGDTLTMDTSDLGHNPAPAQTDSDTFAISVSAVNDAPVVSVPGADSTNEDTAYVLSSGSSPSVADVDANSLKVTYSSTHGTMSLNPANLGALTFSGGSDGTDDASMTFTGTKTAINDALNGSKFTPDANYFSPPNAVITLTADDQGATGSPGPLADAETIDITVTPVNDAPQVTTTSGDTLYTEGDGPTTVDGGVTVADVDSPNLSSAEVEITGSPHFDDVLEFTSLHGITGSYNSTTHVLSLGGSASPSDYQDVLRTVTFKNTGGNPGGSRDIAFRANDGSATSSDASKHIAITETNSAPVITTSAGDTSFTENGGPVAIDPALTLTDDSATLDHATAQITANYDSTQDTLTYTQPGGNPVVAGPFDTGTGKITLSGAGTPAQYEAALRAVKFDNNSNAPSTSARTVTFQADDGASVNNLSNTATKNVTVTAVNDAPVITPSGSTSTFTENGSAVPVDSGITVSDLDSPTLTGGTVTIAAGHQTADALTWTNPGGSGISATFDAGSGTLTLTGTSLVSNYEALLQSIQFSSTSESPGSSRSIDYQLNDGAALNNLGNATVNVNVLNVNDAPQLSPTGTVTFTEGSTASPSAAEAISMAPDLLASDLDDANLTGATVQITGNYQNGEDILSFANTPQITGSFNATTGTMTLSGSDTVANYQAALRDVKYRDNSNSPNTGARTIRYIANDGHASNNLSSPLDRTVNVVAVNDAPVADDETFNGANSAVGNTTLSVNDPDDGRLATPDPTDTSPVTDRPHKEITGDILAGDTDVDGPGGLTVTGETKATDNGGSVTIAPDGDFIFEPEPGASCTDPSDGFDYTVNDGGSPNGSDTGHVTIALSGCAWYVNNDDSAGNSGTSEKPFDTLAQAQTASGNNHTTFVYDGDNTTTGYNTGYTMNTGESLLSEGATLTVGSDTLHTADAANKASLTNNNADVVTLAGGATVKGFNIDPQGTGGGVFGTGLGATTVALDDLNITDGGTKGTQPGLELDTNAGTTTNVSNLTVNNGDASSATSTDSGVRLNNAGTVNFLPAGTISITTNGAKGLDATSTSMGTGSQFDEITVTNSGSGGVAMSSTTGKTSFGDGSGTDLDLTTVSGAPAAFGLSNAGTVAVINAGTHSVHATGGPAVDITGTTVDPTNPVLEFDDVDSTNSANDGVNLDGLGTGGFNANNSGDIGGASGISFDLNGGSGAVTYEGDLNNGTGTTAVEITGRSGGVVSLSGPISDTNDAGGGVNVTSNTGGSTVLSAATKQFNTGASDAVAFTSSDGHTFVLSGGGTDIDTSSGNGLNATTSGTLQVSGSGNTIDSSALGASNRALNIASTDIAAAGATFDHISSSGGANGIRVVSTIASGSPSSLAVTGTGGTCTAADQSGCTGGVIQNATGAGVELQNVDNGVSLTRTNVKNGGDDGIRATQVGVVGASLGITLANSVIANNGNANGESGLDWTNVINNTSITNDAFTSNFDFNAQLTGTSGILNLTVQNSTFTSAGVDDGLQLIINGTATMNSTIGGVGVGNTFTNNKGDGIDMGSTTASPGATSNTTISNNTVTGNLATATDGGIAWTPEGKSKTHINNNNIQNVSATALSVQSSGAGDATTTTDATVNNNVIGTVGQVNSGSDDGDGIQALSPGDGTSKFLIKDNNIHGFDKNGMKLRGSESTNGADTDITAQGNTIDSPDTAHAETAILLQAGSLSADVVDVCADVGGAGGLANTFSGALNFAGPGIGNFWLSLRFPNSKMKAPGYVGTTLTDRQNYFLGRNSGFSGGAAPYVEDGAQNLTTPSPANCQQPTLPSTG